jgi:hypothetical protein
VYRVSDIRQIEIHTVGPLVPDPRPFDVETAIENLKWYKSSCSDQIPAELIQTWEEILRSEIHKLINSMWIEEGLPDQWKQSITVLICKKSNKTDCNNYSGISLLSTSYKILSNILLSKLGPYIRVDEIIMNHECGFRHNTSTMEQIFLDSSNTGAKWEYNETVSHLFIDIKKVYDCDSVGKEVLYNMLIEFGISMKHVRLNKMCLNKTYCKVCIGTQLSDNFPIQNGLKQGDALLPLLFNFTVEYATRKV